MQQRTALLTCFVAAAAAAAGIIAMRLPAQTTSGDSPPVIVLNVQSADNQVSGFRPGARAYYTTTINDDKGLKSVVVTTSPMMHSSSPIDMTSQCAEKTSCEEKVYIIVPSNPGAQFVTVTATDDGGQVSTKTVNFDAPACTASTDCGSAGIQWAGASHCEKNGWIENRIMQYGVAAACESGICNTESLPRFKRQCQDAQVCTFDANGETICVAQPKACSPNAQVTSACMCGGTALNYPVDWRARSPTYCCSGSDGVDSVVSSAPCPAPAPVFSSPSAATTTAFVSSSSPSTSSPVASMPTTATPAALPSSAASSMPSAALASTSSTPSATTPAIHRAAPPQRGMEDTRRESQLLQSQGKQIRIKIKSIEKSIASLEKKIDAKLRLLDRSKRKEVQKRVTVQIEQLEKKAALLEEKKEKLEQELGEFRVRWEELKAEME